MQTILHIGMAKTGSTALQQSLLKSRPYLVERGVLYPKNPPGVGFMNHKLLVADLFEFERLPRHLVRGNTHEELLAAHASFVAGLRKQVAKMKPRCLIISTESLFRSMTKPNRDKLQAIFDSIEAEPEVVAYLRKPSDRFMSGLQQHFKASYEVKPPSPPKYRSTIEKYEKLVGRPRIHLHLFDRTALIDGDIVADFVGKHLAAFGVTRDGLATPPRANETLSAESADLSRRYRLAFHAERDNRFTPDSTGLVAALMAADKALGARRPRLKAAIAELVDYSTTDPLWLRDRYGVVFPNYDYARMESSAPLELPKGPFQLTDLVDLDLELQGEILAQLIGSDWAAAAPERMSWLKSLRTEIPA